MTAERICSLLPSATEIVCALGLEDRLVGVTHECDFPERAMRLPHVTESVIDAEGMDSREIDEAVRESVADQSSIYRLNTPLLRSLQPDLVLTQELCEVCAVGPDEVRAAIGLLEPPPALVSLEPKTVEEVFASIMQVGRLTNVEGRAEQLVQSLKDRIAIVRRAVSGKQRPRVLTMEWLDPVFVGGHWVPEMVEIAGGIDIFGRTGEYSVEVSWPEIESLQPDVVVLMLCGFDDRRSIQELTAANMPGGWHNLTAVRSGRVYVTDGSAHFSRPGPRLLDGVETLAHILHPDVFPAAHKPRYLRWPEDAEIVGSGGSAPRPTSALRGTS